MGIKDVCYASLFAKEDLPTLYQLAEKVRTTHDQILVDDFNLKCQKKLDDHNPVLEIGNQNIEFLQVSKADDLIVTAGINQSLDQILGVSVTRWQYLGKGQGTTVPAIGQTVLTTELLPRVDMSLSGWREYSSASLRFAAIHGESLPNFTINETAVFTLSTAGIMLNRNMFSASPIVHVFDVTGYVISSIIEFVPVMS